MKSIQRPLLLLHFISAMMFALSACGGAGGSDSGSGSSTVFEGQSACSAIGLKSSLKIANGAICPVTEIDNTTSLVEVQQTDGIYIFTCSGTVISPTAVLTAAHCFPNASNVTVTTVVNGVRTRINALEVSIHPGFSQQGNSIYADDVAIIRTASHMAAPISPLLLSRSAQRGEEALIAGFGQTGAQDPSVGQVYAGRAVVQEVTDANIRIDFKNDQAHPCFGDSGGALLLKERGTLAIAGVVSQSDPSVSSNNFCKKGDKTLYTNIDNPSISSFVLSIVPEASIR